MGILKIIGIILGAVLLLIAVLLSLPVRIKVGFDEKGKYFFGIRLLFIPVFSQYSGKPQRAKKKKGERVKKDKKSPVTSRFEGLFGLKELFEGGDVAEALGEGLRIIASILRELEGLLSGCKVKRLLVKAVFSSDDPAKEAMTYGLACAALYPFIGLVQSFMKVSEKGTEIDMRCSFGKEEQSLIFETVIGTDVFSVLKAFLKIIISEAKNDVMKEGTK